MSGPLRFESEQAWLDWRQGRLGGSLIGAILGVDDRESPLAAYHQLTGLTDETKPDTLAMRMGRLGQRLVAQTWIETYDPTIDLYEDVEEGEGFTHPDDERLSCTLDYRVVDGHLAEIKITGQRWAELPPRVEAQARWQLGIVRANNITDAAGGPVDTCHVVACSVPGWRITHWPVEHHEPTWQAMRDAAEGFLANHVDRRRPPRATILDLDRLTASAGTATDPLIATGEQAAQLHAAALDYFDRAARARETAKDADEAKAVLYQLLDGHTTAWAGDTNRPPLVSVTRQTRTSVSTKGLPAELLEELADLGHLTTTEYPTIRVRP